MSPRCTLIPNVFHTPFTSMSIFKLRTVDAKDAEDINKIYSPVVITNAASFDVIPPTVEEMKRKILKTIKTLPWIVCEYNNTLVGYCYACQHRDREAYNWSVELAVYVHHDWHKRGIAKLLYTKLFEILKILGYYNIYAGITSQNTGSVAFHRKMGMEEIGVFKNVGYKLNKWHDVVWMYGVLQDHTVPPKALQTFDINEDYYK